jgi:hypothetical protein
MTGRERLPAILYRQPIDRCRGRYSSTTQPVAVRYAWADNPAGCNLYNGEGLPAAPFRTDDWPTHR